MRLGRTLIEGLPRWQLTRHLPPSVLALCKGLECWLLHIRVLSFEISVCAISLTNDII